MVVPSGAARNAPELSNPYVLPPRYHTLFGACQRAIKRLIDVSVAGIGLVVLAPVLGGIALLLLVDSGRPVLFRWNVVGRRGKYFTGYKYRTMVPNAEALQADLEGRNEMRGPAFKMRQDPRVTRVGRLLRRYSLDELPQLWNVLKGDMSLVGPRPPRQSEWVRFEPWQRCKLAVTPGLTCLWQASGRSEIRDFGDWVRMDLEYIERWNLSLDLRILWRTLLAVVSGHGAY